MKSAAASAAAGAADALDKPRINSHAAYRMGLP
jgi:hypothetical protein